MEVQWQRHPWSDRRQPITDKCWRCQRGTVFRSSDEQRRQRDQRTRAALMLDSDQDGLPDEREIEKFGNLTDQRRRR